MDSPLNDAKTTEQKPDEHLMEAGVAVEAVRELASRLKRFTREREQLLAAERAARSEAERAIRQKDEFLAVLSHELRTPLANVLNWAHVLQERFSDVDDLLNKGLSVIADNTTAQARLISDLLELSRIASGKVALELKPVRFAELIAAAVTAQRPAAEAKRVELRFELAGVLDLGFADPVRLQQVLWNLISNAIKFTPAEGFVAVRATAANGWCEIEVRDSGEGVTPEFLPHLFDRFAQGTGSSARRFGLGLGLSLVKQLVEMHGGQVEARSEGEGKGSTFVVRLPLKPVAAYGPQELMGSWKIDPQAMGPESLQGLRVLAVDDQPAMLEHLKRTLQEHGAEVCAAGSGAQALRLLENGAFDVLVSDIGMPGMDGYELIRTVRARGLGPERLTAVAVTAFAREEDRERILAAGFEAHIAKPIDVPQLITAVRALVQRRSEDPD
ncbi:MAG TPA: ATP-binding protein [Steroidobacter sp.]|nr:ATP-binding protein [Steroidobacter sp.]